MRATSNNRRAVYLLKGRTASPLPSPLWGGSIAEAKRRRSGWGWVLRCVERAPSITHRPPPRSLRGRPSPQGGGWRRARPLRGRPFRLPCQIARAANAAPPGESGCRATHCPLFRFPKGMGAPRPASKFNTSSALSTRTRVPLAKEHGPPLGAPRGFVSQGGVRELRTRRAANPDPAAQVPRDDRIIVPADPQSLPSARLRAGPAGTASCSVSGSSRETSPSLSRDTIVMQFCYYFCQEMVLDAPEIWAILRDARAARGLL